MTINSQRTATRQLRDLNQLVINDVEQGMVRLQCLIIATDASGVRPADQVSADW